MTAASSARFDTLDLLRGVAALAVVTLHYGSMIGPWPVLPHAYLAVDLFFALSGFVIAHAYEQRMLAGEPVRTFMLRRLIRLYPLYLLATVAGWLLVIGSHAPDGTAAWSVPRWSAGLSANLLFLPAPPDYTGSQCDLFPVLFPAWSLLWELVANFFHALIVRRLSRNMLGLILTIGLILVAITAYRFGSLSGGAKWATIPVGACRVAWSYFAGVALQRLHARRPRFKAPPPWLLGGLLLAALAVPPGPWGVDLLLTALLPLLVLAGAQVRQPCPAGSFLGHASYAVYVLHVLAIDFFGAIARWIAGGELGDFGKLALLPLCIGVLLRLAVSLTRDYDEPVRRWLLNAAFAAGKRRLA